MPDSNRNRRLWTSRSTGWANAPWCYSCPWLYSILYFRFFARVRLACAHVWGCIGTKNFWDNKIIRTQSLKIIKITHSLAYLMVQRIFEITKKNRTTSKFYYQRHGLLLVLSGKHSVFSNGMQWLKYFPTWGTFPISQLSRSKLVWVMPWREND